MYKTIRISAGDGGWGGPLTITPTEKCHTVLSVTGGGIHPLAQKLADLSGGVAVDGFKTTLPAEEIMIAVVDCGGTARCGVYPKKKIFTVNLLPVGQAGPLAAFIKPDIYVSAVREKNIEVLGDAPGHPEPCGKPDETVAGGEALSEASLAAGKAKSEPGGKPDEAGAGEQVSSEQPVKDGEVKSELGRKPGEVGTGEQISSEQPVKAAVSDGRAPKTKEQAKEEIRRANEGKEKNIIIKIGQAVGEVVSKFYQAGRETIDMIIRNVLPFMAFTSTLLGIIKGTGLGDVIARTISPLCGSLPGMLVISIICSLPFLSPILGPGAVIAQVVGTLLGSQFATGAIPAKYALPALFAIDGQVGADFIPVGLSLGEAEPETIEMGVPAVLFSRIITGPLAVLIAFVFSIGLY